MAILDNQQSTGMDGGYKKVNEDIEYECHICFNPYYSTHTEKTDKDHIICEKPERLRCGHVFGSQCIYRWMLESNSCPYCRAEIFDYNSITFDLEIENIPVEVAGPRHVMLEEEYASFERSFTWEEWGDGYGQDSLTCICPFEEDIGIESYTLDLDSSSAARLLVQSGCQSYPQHLHTAYGLCNFQQASSSSQSHGAFRNTTYSSYTVMTLLPSNDAEAEVMLKQETADADILMEDLMECHSKWMNEYAYEMVVDNNNQTSALDSHPLPYVVETEVGFTR